MTSNLHVGSCVCFIAPLLVVVNGTKISQMCVHGIQFEREVIIVSIAIQIKYSCLKMSFKKINIQGIS
jgi:hypothetical protein